MKSYASAEYKALVNEYSKYGLVKSIYIVSTMSGNVLSSTKYSDQESDKQLIQLETHEGDKFLLSVSSAGWSVSSCIFSLVY